jgi:hypothetical protein
MNQIYRVLLAMVVVTLSGQVVFGQNNVGIGTVTPDTSAILEVSSQLTRACSFPAQIP